MPVISFDGTRKVGTPFEITVAKNKDRHASGTRTAKEILATILQHTQFDDSYEHPAVLVLVPNDSFTTPVFRYKRTR